MTKDEKILLRCNSCQRENNHDIVATHDFECTDKGTKFSYSLEILECCGCGTPTVRQDTLETIISLSLEGIITQGNVNRTQEIFPPRMARKQPEWLAELPIDLRDILIETYRALHAGSLRLAAMGARATLEYLMLSKITDRGKFKENVDVFFTLPENPASYKDVMLASLDIGSAAIHRGFNPADDDIDRVFTFLESLIWTICIAPKTASALRDATPQRRAGLPV